MGVSIGRWGSLGAQPSVKTLINRQSPEGLGSLHPNLPKARVREGAAHGPGERARRGQPRPALRRRAAAGTWLCTVPSGAPVRGGPHARGGQR